MKAILLAAGLGTRLRPLTDKIPKCLVPIAGRPLLSYWFELLAKHDITDVLINTHHLCKPVQEFVAHTGTSLNVILTHEEELLGSAGTIAANWDFVGKEESFFFAYADNLTDADISALGAFHTSHDGPLTMGLFEAENPNACGIAELGEDGTVIDFTEKPLEPRSRLANAGLFWGRPSLGEFLPSSMPADIGSDLLPRLVGRMYGAKVKGYLRDIGTWESYRKAEEDVAARKLSIIQ